MLEPGAPYIHIYPLDLGRGRSSHCTDKTGICGCRPDHKQVCPESDEHGRCAKDCWKCGGSALVEPHSSDWTTLVIHRHKAKPVYPRRPNHTEIRAE